MDPRVLGGVVGMRGLSMLAAMVLIVGCANWRSLDHLRSPASKILATSVISELSPDGKKLAVVTEDHAFWLVFDGGGPERKIRDQPVNGERRAFFSPGEWSPDSGKLTYELLGVGPYSPIYVYEVETGKSKEVAPHGKRAWWAGTKWVVYDTVGAQVVVDVESGREVMRLSTDEFLIEAFLPATQGFVVQKVDLFRTGLPHKELYLLKPGENPSLLGRFLFRTSSRDGRKLWLNEGQRTYAMLDLPERRVTRMELPESVGGKWKWSLSGDKLAIYSDNLWVIDRERKISAPFFPTSADRGIVEAKWRDNRRLEMVIVDHGTFTDDDRIYFVEADVDTGRVTKTLIRAGEPRSVTPQWVPGGKRVYLRLGSQGLHVFNR